MCKAQRRKLEHEMSDVLNLKAFKCVFSLTLLLNSL